MMSVKRMRLRKIPLNRILRFLLILTGCAALTAGTAGGILSLRNVSGTRTRVLYTYDVTAGAAVRTALKPNAIYSQTWLEGIGPASLTDYLEVTLHTTLQGSRAASLGGVYQVDGVLTGSRAADGAMVYERRFPLEVGNLVQRNNTSAGTDKVVRLHMENYRQLADEAQRTLRETLRQAFRVEFSGTYAVETAWGQAQREFTCSLSIPLGDGQYGPTSSEPFRDRDMLTRLENKTVRPYRGWLRPSLLCALAGATAAIFGIWCVRQPDDEERWRSRMRSALRRHSGRLVSLGGLPQIPDDGVAVEGLSSLMLLSRELRRPVMYCPDPDGLPREGFFFLRDGSRWFFYRRPCPASLVSA